MRFGHRCAAIAVISAAVMTMTSTVQGADPEPLPETLSADALPTYQTNGAVWVIEYAQGKVFVGGIFSNVRPPGAAEGTQTIARANFAVFDAVTGALLPCAPAFTIGGGTAAVRAIEASPDGSRLYIGGYFGSVSGTGVSNLVAFDPATCALVPSATFRRPAVGGTIRALSATSNRVYAGGDFASVDGQTRQRFVGFTSAGQLLPGAVSISGTVHAITAAPEFGKVIVGGQFENVNGVANRGLVAVHPETLAVVQSFPGWIPPNSAVKGLVRDDENFYVAAEGSGFGVFDGRIAGILATGAEKWKDHCLGATQALAVAGEVLYSSHHAHDCQTTPGGFMEDGFRQHFLAQSVVTKEIIPTFFPDTNDGIGVAPQGPRTMVMAGEQLWVGGEFTTVNGVAQRGITRFGVADTTSVFAPPLTVTSLVPGQNRISWLGGWDADDDALTYELFRGDTLIHSVTARSREWSRPTLSYLDDVAPGQQATYRIRVTEPDGENTGARGAAVTVTTASSVVGYAGTVLSDSPSLYWRLDETQSQQAATRTGQPYVRSRVWDLSGSDLQGTAERGYVSTGGYTLGGPSALETGGGTSVTFDGTTGRIASSFTNDFNPPLTSPSEFTIELWARSSSGSGGRLFGFGNRRTELYDRTPPGGLPTYVSSLSTTLDRHLYMNNSGQILFGVQTPSGRVVAKSPGRYNDGSWHHVAATFGPGGMRLFVDGAQVATNPNTSAITYAGYWKVGLDRLSSWPERSSNDAFIGGIDEVAVYPAPLSAARIAAHYTAGRPSVVVDTEPPSEPGSPSATVSASRVDLTWGAASDDVGVVGYDVHRGSTPGFPPTSETRALSVGPVTSASENGVPPGTWYYRVVARDTVNEGPPSDSVEATVVAPPVSTIVQPSADTYVHILAKSTSYGTSSSMTVDGDPEQTAYLRWILPTAPPGMQLAGVGLRLTTTSLAGAVSVDSHPVMLAAGGWPETMTWNARAAVPGPQLGTVTGTAAVSTTYETPLTIDEIASRLGGELSLAIAPGGPDSLQVWSRSAGTGRPTLVLYFSPA